MNYSPGAPVVAATALSGCGTAAVTSAATGERVGVVHARTSSGTVVLLASASDVARLGVAPDGPDGPGTWGGQGGLEEDVAVELEVVVEAALPDLTVPRAQLVLQGWVSLLPDARVGEALDAVCALGDVAELHAHWPEVRVLLVDVAAGRLHWPEGCADVSVEDVAAATPDPVTLREAHVLGRVEAELGDRLVALVRSMGHVHPAPGAGAPGVGRDLATVTEVRCVGADRFGLVLRCRTENPWQHMGPGGSCADADGHGGAGCEAATTASLRLLFPSPVRDADGAVEALAMLVVGASASDAGRCPYAPGQHASGRRAPEQRTS